MGVADRTLMTWERPKVRWRKMYKGKVYTVSCRELGTRENKEASYRAANEWWMRKRADLDAIPQDPPHPHQSILDHLDRRIDWARKNGLERVADNAEAGRYMAWSAGFVEGSSEEDVRPLIEINTGDLDSWAKVIGETIPVEQSIAGLSVRFLKLSEARVVGGELSASEHDLAHRCVQHFVDWIGGTNDPKVITPERWEAYWHHLRGIISAKTRSREYAKKDWRYARSFVEWMASMDKLAMPKNLHDKRYKIGETRHAVETFDNKELRRMVDGARGQLRLHLLLMLNCGFYQSDISDLRQDEVDLDKGYITRQRSKTRQHHGDKVPVVRYKLWPTTLDLMRQHRSNHPELALVNRQGKSWVEEHVVDNRVKGRRDGIKSNFAHLAKDLKITKPLKSFRKTSSTRLDDQPEFSRYAQFFLAQSGKTTADKHYVKPSQERFDEAVSWLWTQYGLMD